MATYIVKSGDTLGAIAKAHGVTLKQILDANPKFTTDPKFKGGNMIWAGTVVKIPTKNNTKPAQPKPKPPTSTPVTPPSTPSENDTYTPPPSTGGGNSYSPPSTPSDPPPINAEPWTPKTWEIEPEEEKPEVFVKSAPIETVQFVDEPFDENLIQDLLFENFAGQEILSIARNDTVNGQSVIYQPIKNLRVLQQIYNPTSLLQLQETSDKVFDNFIIKLNDKIPKIGNGENGVNYFLDLANGSGVIEFVNLKPDEQIEVQIANAGIIEEAGI